MDNNLKDAKEKYNSIKTPENLEDLTKNLINTNKPKNNILKISTGLVAGFVSIFLVSINISETFANECLQIPILKNIVSIFSIYDNSKDDDKTITVEKPILSSNEKTEVNINKINEQINTIIEDYKKSATKDIEDYKQAFIETGGTEEEFKEKNIKVDVSYKITCQSNKYLSFVLTANESWANAYNQNYYYNIDLETGKNVSLKDLLGDNYIEIANNSIINQIETQIKEDDNKSYFGFGDMANDGIDGFKSISENQNFYINENENPVIVFEKYEIAPGYMGNVEFEIKK